VRGASCFEFELITSIYVFVIGRKVGIVYFLRLDSLWSCLVFRVDPVFIFLTSTSFDIPTMQTGFFSERIGVRSYRLIIGFLRILRKGGSLSGFKGLH